MPGRLVRLSVPDRAQRTNCLHRNAPDRWARKTKRRRTQHAPIPGTGVASLRSALEGQLRAFEPDQAIGKLVLDRLELADDAIELPSDLGILDRQLERALRRAECTSGAGEPHREHYVGGTAGSTSKRVAETCCSRNSLSGGTVSPGVARNESPAASAATSATPEGASVKTMKWLAPAAPST